MFLPFLIYDKGFFLYCGDYNSQQIPFTIFSSEWLRGGLDSYSFGIDLGGSVINSFSFYTLGSPFAMVLMLFPAEAIPYLMPFMLCVKFGVAALFSYMYIRRYMRVDGYAMAAAMLYAFSGFGIYNIFFNHFVDAHALFPLLLFSLDEYFYEGRRGLFPLAVALNFLNNYFFFIGQVVFLLIYFIAKLITGEYKLTVKKFLVIALESVIGVMIGALFAIPAFASLLDNPRSIKQASGFNLLLHGTSQQYAAIISSLFLPPDPPYLPNIFSDGVIKWTSMSAYVPVFSVAGVLTFFKSVRRSAVKIVLVVCLIMALVPILNSAFYAFNSSYYARWYYMPILLMALATAKALEQPSGAFLRNIFIVGGITLCYIFFGLVPSVEDGVDVIGVADTGPLLWLTIATAMFGLGIGYCWLKYFKTHRFATVFLLGAICIFSIMYGIIHIGTGKIPQLENDRYFKNETYDMMDDGVLAQDDEFFRVDSYGANDNLSIFLDLNGIRYFNSVVTPSILEFYPSVGVKRDVSSKPEWENYALRSLLSVKYLLVSKDEQEEFDEEEQLYGFEFFDTNNEYNIYINEKFLPMGLVFDEFMSQETFDDTSEDLRALLMLRAVLLNEEQIAEFSDDLNEYVQSENAPLTYDNFEQDVEDTQTATNFLDTGDGFTAEVTLSKPSLVMFSVPYDLGFTAYIDGEVTEVEKVNNGLVAVMASSGSHEIEFKYQTPYLNLSILLFFLGIVFYLAYRLVDHHGQRLFALLNFHKK